ncbi:hypothetical protein GCM10010919_04030 [Alishewanella longhuensis]|uniref:Anti-sigma K factor RskA C-terminal domain-containing protein n=1 Tax=Alishewanella longhuensis TaxID=1091037 RepID=A0ABQ3KWM2_9ALTE|nr:anti-sigma factor [Alishewanella longhuensis]GHG60515.1 hypothetical protein GCM10010919_04030 [Alishewanella longhuensis]
MKYENQELLDHLAVEYILGTLKGAARKRFQKLLISSSNTRKTLWLWEQYLNPLAESLPETEPGTAVWHGIQKRLGWLDDTVVAFTPRKPKLPWFIAAAASFLLLVILYLPQTTAPAFQEVAVIQNAEAKAWWLINKTGDALQVKALDAITPKQDNDYELWMLPTDGSPPISLGLLPQTSQKNLQIPAAASNITIAALAVSLEPKGGSPLTIPSGEVLFVAEIITL